MDDVVVHGPAGRPFPARPHFPAFGDLPAATDGEEVLAVEIGVMGPEAVVVVDPGIVVGVYDVPEPAILEAP